MEFDLANILFFLLVGIAVPSSLLLVGSLLRPRVPQKEKSIVYECGELPVERAWFNFNPRFYIVALVFLVFDVEAVFTYPVAVAFRRFVALGEGALAFVELLVFVAVLLVGLAYVWRRGDLEWIRPRDAGRSEPPEPDPAPEPSETR